MLPMTWPNAFIGVNTAANFAFLRFLWRIAAARHYLSTPG
jgi:hypothetical protein